MTRRRAGVIASSPVLVGAITTLIVILAVRAGRVWGLDGWIRARYPDSVLARWGLG